MSTKYYSGVGSREVPKEIGELMTKIAVKLEELGYSLRSGAAEGSDSAFSIKVKNKEIFILANPKKNKYSI